MAVMYPIIPISTTLESNTSSLHCPTSLLAVVAMAVKSLKLESHSLTLVMLAFKTLLFSRKE
jgi:hypothetical protein